MIVHSNGFGVQSVTIATMACLGDIIPQPDVSIFADPGWESKDTYLYKEWFTPWAQVRGLTILTASRGNIREDALEKKFVSLPLWTMRNGKRGLLKRQCTNEYKIEAVTDKIRELLNIQKGKRVKSRVQLQLGISTDEASRMKPSRTPWITNVYPLIDLGFSRRDCIDYLGRQSVPVPPKSACLGCPYHDDRYWEDLKKNSPEEFGEVCDFDEKMRKKHGGEVFIHKSMRPLRQAKLGSNKDQTNNFENECEGHCGI